MTYVNNGYQEAFSHLFPGKREKRDDIYGRLSGILTPGMTRSLCTCCKHKFCAALNQIRFTFDSRLELSHTSTTGGSEYTTGVLYHETKH